MTQIAPYLFYEDAEAAVEFLTNAFGFEEQLRAIGGAGGLHVELRLDGAPVMLGQATWEYANPRNSDNATAMVHVYVDDVEALRERARSAGARSSTSWSSSRTATGAATSAIPRATCGPSRKPRTRCASH